MLKKIGRVIEWRFVRGNFFRSIVGLIQKIVVSIVSFIYKLIIWIVKNIAKVLKKIFYYIDRVCSILAKRIMAKHTEVVNNKVVFLTFQGDYTCNPKKIADELIKEKVDCQLVWDMKSIIPKSDYPLELKFVKHNTYDFYKELASAKIIIENTNIVERLDVYKKPNQYLFQTWHGSLGIKRLDGDIVMGWKWKRLAKKCQKTVDFLLSNSDFETEVYETAYWKNVPVLTTGHARNDIFFIDDAKESARIKNKVYKTLNIDENKKIFLYAPTHRESGDKQYQMLDYEIIRDALEKRFGGEWQIVIRLHNRLKKSSKRWLRNLPTYVSDATMYEDMQELLYCTEVGVTDYSSWIFDYVLSRKPGFIIELGLEEFQNQRGFYYPIETTPFPIAKDSDELVERILEFDEDKYAKDSENFLIARGCMEDGHASERIVAKIKELMEK